MGFSPDVLTTALQELLPGFSETFTMWNPAWQRIGERGNVTKLKGPWLEFVMSPDGPGNARQIITGTEVISPTRKQNSVRADAYASRYIYSYAVPGKDLAEANNAQDLAKLIQRYPERALAEFYELFAEQFVMGNGGSDGSLTGFFTLNGDGVQYNPNGTARDGFFEVAARGAQTNTVFGVDRSTYGKGSQHQYRDISSFDTNGRKQMRALYRDCAQQSSKADGSPDLIVADNVTYDNYVDSLDSQIRIVPKPGIPTGDTAPSPRTGQLAFMDGAVIVPEHYIVPANFNSAAAQDGVAYFLHTAHWHNIGHGGDSKMETAGDFSSRGPTRLPTQDAWMYELVTHRGMYCDNARCQGLLTGGNSL